MGGKLVRNIVKGSGGLLDPFDFTGAKAEKKIKARLNDSQANAAAAANKAEAEKQAAANLAEDEKKAAADASAKQLLDTQQQARNASLQDFLMGEGDTNQRRKFLRGAK